MFSANDLQMKSLGTYEAYLHKFENKKNLRFIGPQAIFNPHFIPPINYLKKKKARLIKGIIDNAIEDEFSTNISVYGLQGMGKNLHILQYLLWLGQCQQNLIRNKEIFEPFVQIVQIDCSDKSINQFFFSLIQNVAEKFHISLDFQQLLLMTPPDLWSTFKLIIQKVSTPCILYLHKSEYLEENYLSKFFIFAKERKSLQILTSLNTGVQKYSFNNYREMDHRIRIESYTPNELWNIMQQRTIMAFKQPIEDETLDLMANVVYDYDLNVPGAYINILRAINPYMQQSGQITPKEIREISQFHFDGFDIDAFQISEYVMNTSIEDRLFLDYLVNTFAEKSKHFISQPEVYSAYLMSCEELGYQALQNEFVERFAKIIQTNLFSPVRFLKTGKNPTQWNPKDQSYYLTIPLEDAQEIIELAFGTDSKPDFNAMNTF